MGNEGVTAKDELIMKEKIWFKDSTGIFSKIFLIVAGVFFLLDFFSECMDGSAFFAILYLVAFLLNVWIYPRGRYVNVTCNIYTGDDMVKVENTISGEEGIIGFIDYDITNKDVLSLKRKKVFRRFKFEDVLSLDLKPEVEMLDRELSVRFKESASKATFEAHNKKLKQYLLNFQKVSQECANN